jgi:hypothetical protein
LRLAGGLVGTSGLRLLPAVADAARSLAQLRRHVLGRHAFAALRGCCSQMYKNASAFNQNLAGWNTASASIMN